MEHDPLEIWANTEIVVQKALHGQNGRLQAEVSIATRHLLQALEAVLRFGQPEALVDLARWAGNTLPQHGVSSLRLSDHVEVVGQGEEILAAYTRALREIAPRLSVGRKRFFLERFWPVRNRFL